MVPGIIQELFLSDHMGVWDTDGKSLPGVYIPLPGSFAQSPKRGKAKRRTPS